MIQYAEYVVYVLKSNVPSHVTRVPRLSVSNSHPNGMRRILCGNRIEVRAGYSVKRFHFVVALHSMHHISSGSCRKYGPDQLEVHVEL